MRYLLSLLLFVLLVLSAQAQTIWVSSDGAILMTVPEDWQVEETATGQIQATSTSGTVIELNYGDQLGMASDAVIPLDGTSATPFNKAQQIQRQYDSTLGVEAIDVLNQTIFRFDVDESVHFVTTSPSTGTLHAIVNSASNPLLDFLKLWYAFDPPQKPVFACKEIALATTTALPGAVVDIAGIPLNLENFEVQAIDGVNDSLPVPIIAYTDDAYLLAPIHPSFELIGGITTLQFIHHGDICHEVVFNVLPIPEAPGELMRLAEAAQQDLDAALAFFGIKPGDIRGDVISEQLLPLAEIQFMIDHPDNPNSLVSLSSTLEPDVLRLLEALLANDGFVDFLTMRAEYIAEQPALTSLIPPEDVHYVSAAPLNFNQPNFFDIVRLAPINNAQELSYYMRFQDAAASASRETGGVISRIGLANSSMGFIANAAGKLGVRFGSQAVVRASTKAGVVGAVISLTSLGLTTAMDFYAHMLPSQFTRLRYELETTHITNEDDDNIYSLVFVAVDVKSKEWSLTKTVVDAVLSLAGYAGAAKGAASLSAPVSTLPTNNAVKQATEGRTLYSFDSGDAIAAADLASNVCGVAVSSCNNNLVSVGPFEWTNINLQVNQNGGLFVDFYIAANTPERSVDIVKLGIDGGGYVYSAADDGVTLVGVQVKTEAFGGKTIFREQTITVDPIQVTMDLTPNQAKPGDLVCGLANVEHALNDTLRWELKDRNGNLVEPPMTSQGNHEFCFEMPVPEESQLIATSNPDDCSEQERADFSVTAKAITTTGARAFNGDEPREDIGSVYTIAENDVCEGAWRVMAVDETKDLCVANPLIEGFGVSLLETLFDEAIGGGLFNSIITIESVVDGQILVTDREGQSRIMDQDEDLSIPDRVRFIRQMRHFNDRVQSGELVSDSFKFEMIEAPSPDAIWIDQRYRTIYEAPSAPMFESRSDIVMDLAFVSPNTFISRVAWDVDFPINMQGVNSLVSCDIDVLSYGRNLNPQ